MAGFKQFSFKKFGYLDFEHDYTAQLQKKDYAEFIQILFVKAGGQAVIDFKEYQLQQDALFFINPGQFHKLDDSCTGTMLYYNRDFYCVEMHDKEVACDGILFHNVYDIPVVMMDEQASAIMKVSFNEIKAEIDASDQCRRNAQDFIETDHYPLNPHLEAGTSCYHRRSPPGG